MRGAKLRDNPLWMHKGKGWFSEPKGNFPILVPYAWEGNSPTPNRELVTS